MYYTCSQVNLGLQLGAINITDPTCLPLEETTLPDKLRELGYITHAIGKWHLGFSRSECLPTRRGFDSFFGGSIVPYIIIYVVFFYLNTIQQIDYFGNVLYK